MNVSVHVCVHVLKPCVYYGSMSALSLSLSPLLETVSPLLSYYPLRQPHFLNDIFPRGSPPLNNQSVYHSCDSHTTQYCDHSLVL